MKTTCKLLPRLLILFFCFWVNDCRSQNKYAVIAGVNEYYDEPSKPGYHSLHGCVNDAMCMRALLQHKFGFDTANITLLINKSVTQKNVIEGLLSVLKKAKAGDAVVFYFSGHGVYIDNPGNENDPIKKGYNQAICMSDLYAPGYTSLVKDNTLKTIFNLFVDKKIIVTTLFDCCYSGMMMLPPPPPPGIGHNVYQYPNDNWRENVKMYDGFSTPRDKKGSVIPDNTDKNYNLKITLQITDTSKIARPTETKGSRFVSLSASSEEQLSQEITDESELKHGVFTRALLNFYENNSVDVPLSKLLAGITNLVRTQQWYAQLPTYHYDPARSETNFIGVSLQGVDSAITATCISNTNGVVTINAGYNNGLAAGNVFSKKMATGSSSMMLTQVFASSAVASVSKPVSINAGDRLLLIDNYRTSLPLLKVYVPVMNLTTAAFVRVFNESVIPVTKAKGYMDYHSYWNDTTLNNYLFFNQPNAAKQLDSLATQTNRFLLYLALPIDLGNAIARVLQKDQNLQLVSDMRQADKMLCLSYSPVSANNKTPGFVFTYINVPFAKTEVGAAVFPQSFIQVASLPAGDTPSAKLLARQVQEMFRKYIREGTTHWLNMYEMQ